MLNHILRQKGQKRVAVVENEVRPLAGTPALQRAKGHDPSSPTVADSLPGWATLSWCRLAKSTSTTA